MDDSEGHVYLPEGSGDSECFYLATEREAAKREMRLRDIFSLSIYKGDWFDEIKTGNLLTVM